MVKAREFINSDAGISAVVGNGDIDIIFASSLSRAEPGALIFCKALSAEELGTQLYFGGVALVCKQSLAQSLSRENESAAFLISENPRLSFMQLLARHFSPERVAPGIHALAYVDSSSEVDPTASIGPFCYVGPKCTIGANTILYPNVTLYEQVRIGRDVIVHAGAVIGGVGFGYERLDDGRLQQFPHIGGVVIEDEVEIGSNTSIDRGTLEDTTLARGCKIDNQIHVAHNVHVGENAVVIAQSMLGGSVRIGARSWIAPSAVIMNQVSIGDDALVGLGAVVTKRVADGQTVMGSPAMPEAEFKMTRAAIKKLTQGNEA